MLASSLEPQGQDPIHQTPPTTQEGSANSTEDKAPLTSSAPTAAVSHALSYSDFWLQKANIAAILDAATAGNVMQVQQAFLPKMKLKALHALTLKIQALSGKPVATTLEAAIDAAFVDTLLIDAR